jgi:hypothetical protein
MEINWYVVFGLVLRALAVLGMVIFVLPKMVRNLRKPLNWFTLMSILLIGLGSLITIFMLYPFAYIVSSGLVMGDPILNFENINRLVAGFFNLSVPLIIMGMYNYDFLLRKLFGIDLKSLTDEQEEKEMKL